MCGRASQSVSFTNVAAQALGAQLSSDESTRGANQHLSLNMNNLTTNQNTSPGMKAHIFKKDISGSCIQCMSSTWGFSQIKSNKRLFNARSETIYSKPTFQPLISNRQSCVWAVDGYFEWRGKQPYFVNRKDEKPMLLAGLWREENDEGKAFAILTMGAYPDMEWLHPRQPVILSDSVVAMKWLRDPTSDLVIDMCSIPNSKQPSTTSDLQFYPVTKRMSDGKYHGEDCTKEIKLSNIKSFFCGAPNEKSGNIMNNFAGEEARKDNIMSMDTQQPVKRNSALICSSQGRDFKSQHVLIDDEKECMTTIQQEKRECVVAMKQSKEHISETQNSPLKISEEWTCQTCTFHHTGDSIEFLACEMCGTKRCNAIDNRLKHGVDTVSRENKNNVTSRA